MTSGAAALYWLGTMSPDVVLRRSDHVERSCRQTREASAPRPLYPVGRLRVRALEPANIVQMWRTRRGLDFERVVDGSVPAPLTRYRLDFPERFGDALADILLQLEVELPRRYGPIDPESPNSYFNGLAYYVEDLNILMLEYPEFKTLRRTVFDCLQDYSRYCQVDRPLKYFTSWGNVYRDGDDIRLHDHGLGLVSGVIHVYGEDLNDSGHTSYFIPGGEAGEREIVLAYKPGSLLLHPSTVPHSMATFRGTGLRFSIAMDFTAEKLSPRFARVG